MHCTSQAVCNIGCLQTFLVVNGDMLIEEQQAGPGKNRIKSKMYSSSTSVELIIMLYTVPLTLMSMDEILKCDHLVKSYQGVLSCGTVCLLFYTYKTVQSESLDEILN